MSDGAAADGADGIMKHPLQHNWVRGHPSLDIVPCVSRLCFQTPMMLANLVSSHTHPSNVCGGGGLHLCGTKPHAQYGPRLMCTCTSRIVSPCSRSLFGQCRAVRHGQFALTSLSVHRKGCAHSLCWKRTSRLTCFGRLPCVSLCRCSTLMAACTTTR
jgi:hypothetical protein